MLFSNKPKNMIKKHKYKKVKKKVYRALKQRGLWVIGFNEVIYV